MADDVVELSANLRPDTATALDDLAKRMGGNQATALQHAILLADLLYREVDENATITIKKLGSARNLVLPKVDARLAKVVEAAFTAEDSDQGDVTSNSESTQSA